MKRIIGPTISTSPEAEEKLRDAIQKAKKVLADLEDALNEVEICKREVIESVR